MNGITRGKIIQLCQTNNIPVYQKNFSLVDVYDADEAFVTGTFAGLVPVNQVDGRPIGDDYAAHPMMGKLSALYAAAIQQASEQGRTRLP